MISLKKVYNQGSSHQGPQRAASSASIVYFNLLFGGLHHWQYHLPVGADAPSPSALHPPTIPDRFWRLRVRAAAGDGGMGVRALTASLLGDERGAVFCFTEGTVCPRHTFRGISEVLLEQASLLSRSL